MLSLRLLGGATIESDAGPVSGPVAQRRRLALLALLAASPSGTMSRERIAAFLFPEAEPARAHKALADALHAVRKALGRDAVLAVGDALRLNPDVVRSDVGAFEAALAAGEQEQAVALYRGPFLDGFFVPDAGEFERWVDTTRSRLANRHAGALEALGTAAARTGDLARAQEWWSRLAEHDPYSSRAVLRLARTLMAAGDPAAALRQLRTHLALLHDELGVDGDAEVRALADRLRTHEPMERARVHDRARSAVVEVERDGSSAHPPAAPGVSLPQPGDDSTAAREGAPSPDAATSSARAERHGVTSVLPSMSRARPSHGARAAVGATLVVICLLPVLWAAQGWQDRERGGPAAATVTVDPDARDLYLRGRQAWSERSQEGIERAVGYFRQATEREPDYALAYAGLADAYVILAYLGYRPAAAMIPKGKAAALRALELDSTLAEAHAPLGQALLWERDWAGAERAFRAAIRLKPAYATAHQWYAILLVLRGRLHEAVAHVRRASELDPLSLQINNMYGMLLHYAGETDAALRHYEAIIEAEPDSGWVRQNPWLLSNASRVYAARGLYEDALRLLDLALGVSPRHPRLLWDLASTYATMGHPERALAAFTAADTAHGQYAYFRASVFAVVGQTDSSFHWFGRVAEWGPSPLSELREDPRLAPIRSDPRYAALLRSLRVVD